MDSARFDDLLRSFALGLSRRATLGAALSSLFATGSLALLADDAAAKKKKKKKKKKKCKGKKKCGKKCIPLTGCCSAADCGGAQQTCVNNVCQCNNGFKDCNGTCIQQNDCCSSDECAGDLVCTGGDCVCPDDAPFDCPGDVCLAGDQCCDDSECTNALVCVDGFCLCSSTDEITCGDQCCETSADEICDGSVPECQGGGCVANDWCNGSDFFICSNNGIEACVCLTTEDPTPEIACVDFFEVTDNVNCNASCEDSTDCPTGSVCVPGDTSPDGFCGCQNNFCASRCEGGTQRRAGRRRNVGLSMAEMRSKKRGR